jgi:glucosamine--fructose-6-phosphate aminotransferase (isomerizing)
VGLWTNQTALLEELDKLPDMGRSVIEHYSDTARAWGKRLDIERFYFLGSGPRYGLAAELSLKMKEMTLSHSEPFHFPEFRHGPQSMVTENTLMVGLVSVVNREIETAVLEDMRKRGAHVMQIGEQGGDTAFNSGLSETAHKILCLPIGQLMAFARALEKGLDPDHPHNLDAVVRLSS